MPKLMERALWFLLLGAVVLMAGLMATQAEVSPAVFEEWNSEEMPVYMYWGNIRILFPAGIYGLTLGIINVAVLWVFSRKKVELHWLAFALLMCAGLMVAVGKWPKVNVGWDEEVHRKWVYRFANWENIGIREYCSLINTWFFAYIPYTVGMALGKLLGLTESWALRLSFAMGSVVYAGICSAAVKVTPKYKLTFMVAALLPTCIFQAACISYDAMVIACILLGVALWLRELSQPELPMSGVATVVMVATLSLGTMAKPAYSLLLLLLWLLPAGKFESKGRKWLFRVFVVVLLVMCLYSMLLGMYDDQMSGDARFAGTDSAGQLRFILEQPGEFLSVMGNYILQNFKRLFLTASGSWAHLGSNATASWVLLLLLWLICPLCSIQEKDYSPLTWQRRVAMACVVLLPILALMLAQYMVSSPVGHHTIEGMQPRYVLPILTCAGLVLMLPEKLRAKTQPASRWIALGVTVIVVFILYQDGWTYIMGGMQGASWM